MPPLKMGCFSTKIGLFSTCLGTADERDCKNIDVDYNSLVAEEKKHTSHKMDRRGEKENKKARIYYVHEN